MGAELTDAEWAGRLVSAYMRRSGLNYAEMGRLLGTSANTVANVAKGKRAPTFWLLKALHKETSIPYDAFFREGKYKQVWQKM